MLSDMTYDRFLIGWTLLAAVVFFALMYIQAPYGRFSRPGWGPCLSSRLSWLVMESPAVIVVTWLFITGWNGTATALVFFLLWSGHYVYRSVIYPWQLRSSHRVPVTVTAFGWCFNVVNAYLQAAYLFHLRTYPASWLWQPRFTLGLTLFVLGFAAHVHSDTILRSIRQNAGTGYSVPRGGLFRWLSCPNYFGELVEWVGWAMLTWSWPGLVFAAWTAANLIPRAVASHRWYRTTFAEYPHERRAVIPWVL